MYEKLMHRVMSHVDRTRHAATPILHDRQASHTNNSPGRDLLHRIEISKRRKEIKETIIMYLFFEKRSALDASSMYLKGNFSVANELV
jgi:hypothetical protein